MSKKFKHPTGSVKKKQFVLPKALTQRQADFIDAITHKDMVIATGSAGTGKTFLPAVYAAYYYHTGRVDKIVLTRPTVPVGKGLGFLPGPQPLDALLLTPSGWKSMGSIEVGDYVIGRNGIPTKVLNIFPKGDREVFKLKLLDGSETECCGEHPWLTRTWEDKKRNRAGTVKSTSDIAKTLHTRLGRLNHYLPRVEAVQFELQDLTIPAYTLGVLLGDGYMGDSISFASIDSEIVGRVNSEIASLACLLAAPNGISYSIVGNVKQKKPSKRVLCTNLISSTTEEYSSIGACGAALGLDSRTISSRCSRNAEISGIRYSFLECEYTWAHPIKEQLEALHLQGLKSYEKFIPHKYKYASVEQRLAVLRGLMDTDGTVKKTGEASFTTTSKQLAKDLIEIVRSLGGRAKLCERNRIGKTSLLLGRAITARRISYEFTISLPSEMNPFFLPRKALRFKTKYSHYPTIKSITKVGIKQTQCIQVEDPEHLYVTNDYIVTHNTLEEKLHPWVAPFIEVLTKYLSVGEVECMLKNGKLEVVPFDTIRGRTFDDSFIILDEAQNTTITEIKAFVTRTGQNSKIVINGDTMQSDLKSNEASGLEYLVDTILNPRNKDLAERVGFINFTFEDCVRSNLCKLWLKAFN